MTRTKKVRIANPAKLKKLNSALLVSISKAAGAANPNKKRKTMKKKTSKKKNPAVGAASPKKSAPKKKNPIVITAKRRHAKKRSNPMLFGRNMNTLETLTVLGGGLVGVTVTKLVPAYLPIPDLTNNATLRVLVSGATAFLAGYFASKMKPDFGSAVMFGGGMQTLSVALNAFLPAVGSQFGLRGTRRGVGVVVPLPQAPSAPENPFRPRLAPAPALAMPAKAGVSGVYSAQY